MIEDDVKRVKVAADVERDDCLSELLCTQESREIIGKGKARLDYLIDEYK